MLGHIFSRTMLKLLDLFLITYFIFFLYQGMILREYAFIKTMKRIKLAIFNLNHKLWSPAIEKAIVVLDLSESSTNIQPF